MALIIKLLKLIKKKCIYFSCERNVVHLINKGNKSKIVYNLKKKFKRMYL